MKIIKRAANNIPLESAHAGSGSRRLLLKDVPTQAVEAMTDGFLPVGAMFDWHNHEMVVEIMYVLAGSGKIHDEDGEYDYVVGDLYTFPAGIKHKIVNTGDAESRMIFVRMEE